MALKIFGARYVRTEFYLCMDSDIRLVKPFTNASMLMPSGKALVNWNDYENSDQKGWYEASANVIKGHGCIDPRYKSVIGVTPQVLHRYVALASLFLFFLFFFFFFLLLPSMSFLIAPNLVHFPFLFSSLK